MLRGFGSRFILGAALMWRLTAASADPAPAAPTPDVKLPPGTRYEASSGAYVAGRGLRDSTDFIAKELARKGIATEQVGPYRIRGIELTRFLNPSESSPWAAIHVVRIAGKTLIFFVPRAKA